MAVGGDYATCCRVLLSQSVAAWPARAPIGWTGPTISVLAEAASACRQSPPTCWEPLVGCPHLLLGSAEADVPRLLPN